MALAAIMPLLSNSFIYDLFFFWLKSRPAVAYESVSCKLSFTSLFLCLSRISLGWYCQKISEMGGWPYRGWVVYRIGEGSQTFRKIWGKYEGHHVCKGGWFPEIGVALTYIGRCCSQKLRDILKKLIQRKFWHGMFYVVACSMESQKIHLIIVMIFSPEYSYWVALGLFSYRNITHNIALEKNELQIDELPYIMIEFSKNCLNIQAFQPSKNPSPRNVWNVETLE